MLKAPVDAAKVAEAQGDLLRVHAELVGDGHGGRGIEHIVASGDMQFKRPQRPQRGHHLKAREAALPRSAETPAGSRLRRQRHR